MSSPFQGECPAPFLQDVFFTDGGYVDNRLCEKIGTNLTCCLPCPMTDWVYPNSFNTVGVAAEWLAVVSTICCLFMLASWAVLPVDKTSRHYLSICLTAAVMILSLGFVIPLAGRPQQCYDPITPNDMHTSSVCAASGAFIIFGGWGSVFWVFLRSLSLHLQICWQVVVGRTFMWFSQIVGWGIPIIGLILALVFSGVSFRFGATCHINHNNSLADLWIPLLVFAGITIIIQFATFGYCIKVYLASLADNSASTEGSNMPSYSNSIRTMTPKQAYRRVRRVIQLQWRGIAIVLIIVADVIFFSVIFVFQDNTVQAVKNDESIASNWVACLYLSGGDRDKCLPEADPLVVNLATVAAVLVLLAMNGLWIVILLGRWSMVTSWSDLIAGGLLRSRREFVSVDARLDDLKNDTRSYEMLSRDSGKTMDEAVTPSAVTPISPIAKSPIPLRSPSALRRADETAFGDLETGRRTPDYFGNTARYHTPARSFSSPRPPQSAGGWDPQETYARPTPHGDSDEYVNPLGMNRI